LLSDLKHLKAKVEAGAEYIVTQLFYDNAKVFQLCKAVQGEWHNCADYTWHVKPISNKKQLQSLPKFFHIEVPEALADAIEKCEDDKKVKEVGIEWGIKQCKELSQVWGALHPLSIPWANRNR
jgi:methylenetetrahydrofolate reductase (NADPH)